MDQVAPAQCEDANTMVAHVGNKDAPRVHAQPARVAQLARPAPLARKGEGECAIASEARDAVVATVGDIHTAARSECDTRWLAQVRDRLRRPTAARYARRLGTLRLLKVGGHVQESWQLEMWVRRT